MDVFGKFSGKASIIVLKHAALPQNIIKLGTERINKLWRNEKLRVVGMFRAKKGHVYDERKMLGDIRRETIA